MILNKKQFQTTYADSGVNIDAGNTFIEKIKPLVRMTQRLGTEAKIGDFGGMFDLSKLKYKNPLLISSTDGVGTKLKIAQHVKNHKTIGIDLVAMCVNDLIVHGAEPLFFLDYFACGTLLINDAADVIAGIAHGCKESNCALIGGETAEMPGMYQKDEYDLAGFAVGIVEKDQLLPKRDAIMAGDIVLGIASSGIHSNGYSLVRYLIHQHNIKIYDAPPFDTHHTYLHQALLEPTKIYVKTLLPLMQQDLIKGAAHITGGGLLENIPRILPDNLRVIIDSKQWQIPPIFSWIAQLGNISNEEMQRTFNLGIGMVLIVAQENVDAIKSAVKQENIYNIGVVSTVKANQNKITIV